jgi:cation:H+ antiporter
MQILIQLLLLVVGFVMLIKGADVFVDAASRIADKFGIPKIVVGLTIVAFGTSAPEAAVSISSAMKGSAELAVSNVLGSNIMNVLLILGIASVIYPLAVQKSTICVDIPYVFVISIVLLLLGMDGVISRMDGVILWIFFIVYLIYMVKMALSGQASVEEGEEAATDDKLWKLLIALVIGAAAIVIGANITVDAASALARIFGMSERLIGLTIVAFGTSLPELVTSSIAASKKEADIAVGNIVGSNLFNILFVLGTTALLIPVEYSSAFIFDNIVAVGVMLLLWLCVFKDKKLGRMGGVIMLLCYAAYFVKILLV